MNAEGTKRLALMKSLVEEQGADGDKRWIIDQLVVSEATCQSLREQSSRWEAQALEAGAKVRELRDALEDIRDHAHWTSGECRHRVNVALAEESIWRGLSQKATIDRGSFARYATETITTSEATKAALAESQEGKG